MVLIGTEQREHINYFGQDAVIVSDNKNDNTITLMLEDGTQLTVSKYLSVFNAKKIDNSERIARIQEIIDERTKKIKEQDKIWHIAKENIRKATSSINRLFSSLGVTHAAQITKKEDKEKYLALVTDKSTARMLQIRASSEILSDCNSNLSDIYTKSNYQNQEMLFA